MINSFFFFYFYIKHYERYNHIEKKCNGKFLLYCKHHFKFKYKIIVTAVFKMCKTILVKADIRLR